MAGASISIHIPDSLLADLVAYQPRGMSRSAWLAKLLAIGLNQFNQQELEKCLLRVRV
jgi:hypothetical protein